MKTLKAQVHRFRDYVAVYVGDGQTTYLSDDEAERLANNIIKCVEDIRARKFTDSQFNTVEIFISEKR
jgi:hypothetical protein